jgi:hypothetical protein
LQLLQLKFELQLVPFFYDCCVLLALFEIFKCLLPFLVLLYCDVHEVFLVGVHVSFVQFRKANQAAVLKHAVEVLRIHLHSMAIYDRTEKQTDCLLSELFVNVLAFGTAPDLHSLLLPPFKLQPHLCIEDLTVKFSS